MNFVLHRHLAARDLRSDAAGLGGMLPDLWRMADRRVRARGGGAWGGAPGGRAVSSTDEVLAGVAHHLEVDRWFHDDAVFTEGEHETAHAIRAAALAAPRPGLFAHVLWEMCLDGAFVRLQGFDAVMGAVRASVRAASTEALAGAASIHHFQRVQRPPAERVAFETRLARILAEVARGPWIEGYQHGPGVAERLQGVRRGLGLELMSEEDLRRLSAAVERLLTLAEGTVARILAR